ncbi:MAG: glycosyltransferase [Candidatus Omnitrophica bacterium]|nr:glycosyltransferase [Candidatus Omnitrophota bacterium]
MKIGFYMPVFNAQEYIKEALPAVFAQSLKISEFVAIDDASTDNTAEILKEYKMPSLVNQRNLGIAACRNAAVKHLKTEFIASLDADCLPDKDWLKNLMRRFDSPKIAGVGGKLIEKNQTTAFDRWRATHMRQFWQDKKQKPKFLFGSNTVFRRDALIDAGLYNEVFKLNYEDVDICRRLREKGYAFIYEPGAVVYHLKKDNIFSLLNSYWEWHRVYYEEKGFYSDQKNFILKIKDTIGLANRYLRQDFAAGRHELLFIDFILSLQHTLKDWEYYVARKSQIGFAPHTKAHIWLSLFDITFCSRIYSGTPGLPTLLPAGNAFMQNYFAMLFIINKGLQDNFKSAAFKKAVFRHLLQAVYNLDCEELDNILLIMNEKDKKWEETLLKKHAHLDAEFLKEVFKYFNAWLTDLHCNKKELLKSVMDSAEQIDTERLKGEKSDEAKKLNADN